MLLALMKTGTDGTTKAELKELCGFPICPYILSKGFAGLTEHLLQVHGIHLFFDFLALLILYVFLLKTSEDAQVVLANAVFAAEGYKFSEEFIQFYVDSYAATLRNINFSKAVNNAAATEIDHWISEVTSRKVTAIASAGTNLRLHFYFVTMKLTQCYGPEDVDLKTRLVFVNVVTFKGQWARAFSTWDTEEKPFHVSPEKTIKVPFMTATYKFPIADLLLLGAKAVGLHYKVSSACHFGWFHVKQYMNNFTMKIQQGRRLILMIIVPNKAHGLKELLKKLDVNFYSSIRGQLRITGNVALEVPKWKVTSKLELKPVLQNVRSNVVS